MRQGKQRAPHSQLHSAQAARYAKNIILFIGDGMGEVQRTAARWVAGGADASLVMDRLPYLGWSRTASADNPITDSAAAGTALATGVKTNNGVIGMDPQLRPQMSVLERAQAQGMSVGLVTTVQITHATPAAFAAHAEHRSEMTEIARQLVAARIDVLLGGGLDDFTAVTEGGATALEEALTANYTVLTNGAALRSVEVGTISRLLGLFGNQGMERPFTPSLAEMTSCALRLLSGNPAGFFLMVEGGQIDWAGHSNDASNAVADTLAFDEAVAVGCDFAEAGGDTLLIVTADHETGGMTLSTSAGEQAAEAAPLSMPDGTPFYVTWETPGHTGVDVPTNAVGPRSELLAGSYENTHINDVMCMALRDNLLYRWERASADVPRSQRRRASG